MAGMFVVNNLGWFPIGNVKDSSSSGFYGGMFYSDAITSFIWFENQVFLGSSDIFLGKESF